MDVPEAASADPTRTSVAVRATAARTPALCRVLARRLRLPRAGNDPRNTDGGECAVSNTDEAKGRLKEAAGDLTDNDDLQREGKIDRATGSAKDKVDRAADKVKDVVDSDD
jgi:uncharacterized protein YjbJ (UPF0337 family)